VRKRRRTIAVSTFRRNIQNTFLTGFVIVFPISITVVLLVMMFNWLDHLFAPWVFRLTDRHIPGLGIISTLLLIFGVGLLVTNIVGRKLVAVGEILVAKIPLIRNVYAGAKQFLETLTPEQRQGTTFTHVVVLAYPRPDNYVLGFVTGEVPEEIQKKFSEPILTVFIARTPNPLTGFLYLVPRKAVTFLPISVEEGMTIIVSGGLIYPPEANHAEAEASVNHDVQSQGAGF